MYLTIYIFCDKFLFMCALFSLFQKSRGLGHRLQAVVSAEHEWLAVVADLLKGWIFISIFVNPLAALTLLV